MTLVKGNESIIFIKSLIHNRNGAHLIGKYTDKYGFDHEIVFTTVFALIQLICLHCLLILC